MAHIEVTIDKDGNAVVDAIGFQGGECLEETRSIEAALGRPVKRTEKPELQAKNRVQQKGG